MTEQEKAAQKKQATLKAIHNNFKGISTNTECARLLTALTRFAITTYEARRFLDIYDAPARVLQLRKRGYDIVTHRQTIVTEMGTKHSVGLYSLVAGGRHE